ncbi:MAG: pilus assembly protein [Dehalococcoidia bacterium]|nr:pilus assembly protein [Dehalococcoidia bacterium]
MPHVLKSEGQAVVELVLVLPLILLMIFAVVEFGFALNSHLAVSNAAAEGARYGALGSPPGNATCAPNTVRGRALNTSAENLECSEITVSYPGGPGSVARGDSVVVHVSHHYAMVTPLGSLMAFLGEAGFPASITLSACSTGRLEQAPAIPVARGGPAC